MSNEIQAFESKHMLLMANVAQHIQQEKLLKEQTTKLKEDLGKAMDEFGIKSIDNDLLKITRTAASTSKSLDTTRLKNEEPELFAELMTDYPKITNRSASLTIKVK
ncbi:hypothetical protein P9D39_24210 [Heyndrickxia oleronia]|uniref:Uncharacterized protein n=1 Tax=Heyndrickxia oleronia TaxID=38875 RepID=A0A8E2LFG7_9BACI|nr:hypothetical protein [Heyndrickxia oleronia]MEC1377333.1 hypothetical protein [Heyndrickxia oleronia]OOP70195.1 hypothetical protein BWZ43_01225 [Heyndrickxia oleronia]QQZ05974.1 hypothetical protein I5818_05835 [Heyndrickxia oleronia]